MDDIIGRMRSEEAELVRKLDAVRHFLKAYASGSQSDSAASPRSTRSAASPRSLTSRKDKFGSYGQGIIDTSVKILPAHGNSPMPTRDLVEKLERYSVEVRGENKVNALSALLARSTSIQGYGRSGWTRAAGVDVNAEDIAEILGDEAQNGNAAPDGEANGAAETAGWGVQPPSPAFVVKPNPWPGA